MKHARPKHALAPMQTQRERATDALARLVCAVAGHVPDKRFTGDTICSRCRTGLGRWRA